MRCFCIPAAAALWVLAFSSPVRCQAPAVPAPARPQSYALLVGIDTYQPRGTNIQRPAGVPAAGRFAGGVEFPDLTGPQYDVANMRALLVSAKFAFPDDNTHIHILKDGAATHKAILDALNAYVVDQPKRGDRVVFYMSGHGSLRVNSLGTGQDFDMDGTGKNNVRLEGTVVTADAYQGSDDITSRDLRRIFNKAADKGILLTAIFDTCHSGGQARGAGGPGMVPRALAFDPRDMKEVPDANPDGTPVTAPQDRKDNPVLVFSAAQRDQMAVDVRDGKPPHGLFTSALIEALQGLPDDAAAGDVYAQVLVNIEHTAGAGDQQPALDASATRRLEPLLGGQAAKGPAHAAVAEVKADGTILLDIGQAADIGEGSVLTQVTPRNGVQAVVRVTGSVSLARSSAELTSAPPSSVHQGDILELTRWIHVPSRTATFFAGSRNLTLAQIQKAVSAVRSTRIPLVRDPSADLWTHLVSWNGTEWILEPRDERTLAQAAESQPRLVHLGPTLTSASLTAKLPPTALLWLDVPLPAEFSAGLINDANSAAMPTDKRSEALYLAAGMPTPDGVQYAWYHRTGFDTQERTPPGYGKGCSAGSPYPLRTDWAVLPDTSPSVENAVASLNDSAALLTRLDGWLELKSSTSGTGDFPYTLTLRRSKDDHAMKNDDSTYKDERYTLSLAGDVNAIVDHSRWVYVLGIDCQGHGAVIWPSGGPGGKFPNSDGVRMENIPLANSAFHITPPFGTDTFILLTTSTPLPNPNLLRMDGVVKNGTRGAQSALDSLLASTSAGTRGATGEVPTDWGVQTVRTHSQPVSGPAAKP